MGVGGTPPGPPAARMPERATARDFQEADAAALPDAAWLRSATELVTELLKTELCCQRLNCAAWQWTATANMTGCYKGVPP